LAVKINLIDYDAESIQLSEVFAFHEALFADDNLFGLFWRFHQNLLVLSCEIVVVSVDFISELDSGSRQFSEFEIF
jgi:hypothetical protein